MDDFGIIYRKNDILTNGEDGNDAKIIPCHHFGKNDDGTIFKEKAENKE